MRVQAHLPGHTAPELFFIFIYFFLLLFYDALSPQKPYGLLGTGKEWDREREPRPTTLSTHAAPEVWKKSRPICGMDLQYNSSCGVLN